MQKQLSKNYTKQYLQMGGGRGHVAMLLLKRVDYAPYINKPLSKGKYTM